MNLVILDADVIIKIFEIDKFDFIMKRYKLKITEAIAEEAKYYLDPTTGVRVNIELPFEHHNFEIIEDISIDEIIEFEDKIKGIPIPEIHEGEISGIILTQRNPDYKFCTGDHSAMTVMGILKLTDQAISLEELIRDSHGLSTNFTRNYLNESIKEGQVLRVQYLLE